MDESVGRILKKLDDLHLTDNTVVIFTSDNGGLSVKEGPKTPATSNAPLRAGKGYLYEGGIREPLIVRWPGNVQPGSVCATPVSSIDFFPTMLEMAGIDPKTFPPVDGLSIVPLLKGAKTLPRASLFWHYPHYSNQGGKPSGAIRGGDLKLIEFYEDGRWELYNLKEDLSETNNLAAALPKKAAELQARLDAWRRATGAQMMLPNPDYRPGIATRTGKSRSE
jgi:arylsulfatase A-like enzyme